MGRSAADREFAEWFASFGWDEPDPGGQVGTPVPGTMEFYRELFDDRGPVSREALSAAWLKRQLELVERAVPLFKADVGRTTALTPAIEVRLLDDGVMAVTYDGCYRTPVLQSIKEPESICDVVDNLRDWVFEDLWAPWPMCARHGRVLDPRPIGSAAVWQCPAGHAESTIGELRTP